MAPTIGDRSRRPTTGGPLLVFDAAVHTGTGPRPENQDSAVAGPRLLAVADGVGGSAGGGTASALVAGWLAPLDRVAPGARPGLPLLREVVAGANARIAAARDAWPRLRAMATTLVAVLAEESGLAVAHIGDSRLYLLRAGRLAQVTVDQSFVQALVDGGGITAAEAAVHPHRSRIYAALRGEAADLDRLQVTALEARAGDRLLLCSDGLSDVVPADRLEQLLAVPATPAGTAHDLVRAALDGGASDNVTALVADVVDARSPRPCRSTTVGAASQPAVEVIESLEAVWPGSGLGASHRWATTDGARSGVVGGTRSSAA
ncbi:protein phosphatase 2C domain-containing protein [Geodermatophilus sp. YIM 151500]|uniref:PP2C family protein-serine/threonine phosphatase n=1 Tax=Geodermatophilus sp. YIM 151500 TaxID=2984531 RepID=UPI0021E4E517|nr:protein phosphatase 2C domain-containing protein [Geodermatophilus sp. YIM 151500]MCV2491937.1 protein phosphatase 2C domain-containing protein [Geodermatophilus sp. YIM 151500]